MSLSDPWYPLNLNMLKWDSESQRYSGLAFLGTSFPQMEVSKLYVTFKSLIIKLHDWSSPKPDEVLTSQETHWQIGHFKTMLRSALWQSVGIYDVSQTYQLSHQNNEFFVIMMLFQTFLLQVFLRPEVIVIVLTLLMWSFDGASQGFSFAIVSKKM